MKKNRKMVTLVAAILAALTVILLFASCNGVDDPATNTSQTSDQSSVPQGTHNTADTTEEGIETQTTSEKETEQTTQTKNDTSPTPSTKSKAELLMLYNNALASGRPACVRTSQKITKGDLWIGNDSDSPLSLLSEDQTALREKFEKTSAAGVSLPALNESSVKSALVSGSTVTFTLNNFSVSDSIKSTHNGYINLIDDQRASELVDGVKEHAGVSGNVKITYAAYKLSDGKLSVVFSNDFKKIVSVQFSAKQNVRTKMRYLVMTINADLDYIITSEYK